MPALPDGIAVGRQSRGRCFTGVRGPAPLGLPSMERRNANRARYTKALPPYGSPLVVRVRGFAESRDVRVYARIGSERVFLPCWLPPRKRTERATLPREGPPRVGVPNCTGLVPGSDVSLRHATEKSRQSSAAAACSIASANVARNHLRSSGDRSETRQSPSLRREHNLSRQRPELSASSSTQHGDWRSTLPCFSYAAGFAAPGFWSQVHQGLCEPDLHIFAKLFEDRLERGTEEGRRHRRS